MAGFKMHITTSTVLGVGYGTAAYLAAGIPLDKCLLAAGLCSVSGMLPDLDSDSGVPVRESFAFAAAVVPMLMVDRFQHMGLSYDSMVLAAGLIYIAIRFGVAQIFKRYTVHRGMWHSLPAAATVGLLAYLICSCDDTTLRCFKAIAVVLGFMSHLVLDEIYSVDFKSGIPRLKKSFGTAIKFYSKSSWANISTYGKLIIVAGLVFSDSQLMQNFREELPQNVREKVEQHVPHTARDWFNDAAGQRDNISR